MDNQTPITTPEILQVDAINGLEVSTREAIQKAFLPFAQQFAEWEEKAKEIVVTDVSETDKMKAAGEARKAIKKIRTGADAVRKSLKEDSLKYGKAVQDVYNKIEESITPIEEYLETQEKFKELEEAKQRQLVIAQRMDLLKDFPSVTSEMVINLDEDNFQVFIQGLLDQKAKREEEERKEYEQQQERIRINELHHERRSLLMEQGLWVYLDPESQSQNFGEMKEDDFKAYIDKAKFTKEDEEKKRREQAEENERLKKAAEQKQRDIEAANMIRNIRTSDLAAVGYSHHSDIAELSESEFAMLLDEQTAIFQAKERKAEADRKEKEKIDAENKRLADELKRREDAERAQKLAEEKEKADKIAEMKRIAIAGDKEKLEHWMNTFTAGQIPTMSKDESLAAAELIQSKFLAFKEWAATEINKL